MKTVPHAHAAARHVADSVRDGFLYSFNRRDSGHAIVTFTPRSGGHGVTVYFAPHGDGIDVYAWDHEIDMESARIHVRPDDAIDRAARDAIRACGYTGEPI